MRTLLHICNNYYSSSVHYDLIKATKGHLYHYLFVPIKHKSKIEHNNIQNQKIFFYRKYLSYFQLIKSFYIFFSNFSYFKSHKNSSILAHTLWSDGLQAFYCFLFFGCEYSVVVRNSDINIFLRYQPYYRFLFKFILNNASNVIFVSFAHKRTFESRYSSLYSCCKSIEVIPNGLTDFWINNICSTQNERPMNVCFVGRFNKNKNIIILIKAITNLRTFFPDLTLTLVGGTKEELDIDIPDFVYVVGKIKDKKELLYYYRGSRVFAMVSHFETFGLVYLEAISQGCSVLCTKNQGIDGFFNSPFVLSTDPNSINNITCDLKKLLSDYSNGTDISFRKTVLDFSWSRIGQKYLDLIK